MVARTMIDRKAPIAEHRRGEWLLAGILSGFAATMALTAVIAIAYVVAASIGQETGGTLSRWLWALANNPLTNRTENGIFLAIALNLVVGLLFALVYARFFEPYVPGVGWVKGMLFSLFPWLLSIAVFLPAMGAGPFGLDIDAGPLPILGNLVAHLVYGAILGGFYSVRFESWLDDREEERTANAGAERGAAIGLFAGLPTGAIVGFLVSPSLADLGSQTAIILAGALAFGGVGLLIGSLAGIGDEDGRMMMAERERQRVIAEERRDFDGRS